MQNSRLNARLNSSTLKNCIALLIIATLISGCSFFRKDDKVDENATVEELYARAKESMEKRNWNTAVERLRAVEAKFPYGVYAEQAQLDTVYAYYKNDEPGLAIAAADRFIKLYPAHASVDYAYYLKGLSSYEEDDSTTGVLFGKDDLSDRDPILTQNALNAFKDVYTLFPNSRYAPSAKERVQYLTNALAKHEIAVASYYYSRDAHVAVVNRTKGIVENYPSTAAVEEALALQMYSYQAMNLQDLADDSRSVLELNFPNSEYLDGSGEVTGRWYSSSAGKKKKKEGNFFTRLFKRQPKPEN